MTKPPPPSPPAPPALFDRTRLAQRRDRSAAAGEDYAFLRQRLSSALLERLQDTPRQFERGMEFNAAGGALSRAILEAGKASAMCAADLSPRFTAMARQSGLEAITLDEENALSLGEAQADLIVSLLGLHWVNDLPGTLIQFRRLLQPDGLFLGALFGAGTLAEWRAVLTEAEIELTGALAPRLSPLPDVRDAAGLLQRAGYALPVADREAIEVWYSSVDALLADLKGMGERAAFARGFGQPLPRRVLALARSTYRERFSRADGKLRATFEIVWLSGWAPAPHQPKPLARGSAKTSLAEAVRRAAKDAG